MPLAAWLHRVRRRFAPGVPLWFHEAYRLPLTTMEARLGADPRRAELALAWLLAEHEVGRRDLRAPEAAPFADLLRVHTPELVERVTRAEELARILGVDRWDVDVDQVLGSVRLAVGGTIAAAREAVHRRGPTANLLGGFHHAGPGFAGGHCVFNDIAIAVAVLRSEGFTGRVAVLDLDAHPPDGTAACLAGRPDVWIGSLSGSAWGALPPDVDETVLPPGSGDPAYLHALDALLARLPRVALAFVLAGGDVLAGDKFGALGLTVEGARARDHRVHAALAGTGSVWLPAGGYHPDAWRILAGALLEIAGDDETLVPAGVDPLRTHFDVIARSLPTEALTRTTEEEDALDIESALGLRRQDDGRFLGVYTRQGVELALESYGILRALRRLGYPTPRVVVDHADLGDRMRIFGPAAGSEQLLVEVVLDRERHEGQTLLYVHWLTLRHPLGALRAGRPLLPGQEVPGLGLAREAGELLRRIAMRLQLDGVALRPAHFHIAYASRYRFRFVDDARQARFEALIRDLGHLGAAELSRAVARGDVRCDGAPYRWEAELMVAPLDETTPAPLPAAAAHHFTLG